jgi:hypothetical protein
MITLDDKIYFGFSADYPNHYSPGNTQPTIVFFGSPDMFAKFARWLEERSNRAEGSERLNDAAFFSHANVDVLLTFLTRSRGMRQVDEHTLEWGLASREIDTFSRNYRALPNPHLAKLVGSFWTVQAVMRCTWSHKSEKTSIRDLRLHRGLWPTAPLRHPPPPCYYSHMEGLLKDIDLSPLIGREITLVRIGKFLLHYFLDDDFPAKPNVRNRKQRRNHRGSKRTSYQN